mmetsp:Transcript_23978/g.25676  ORF Transcript_23978/g.25676 Transcript_23978/m.25676 type:complete len:461 (+) Transcript_23978:150-1532(+)
MNSLRKSITDVSTKIQTGAKETKEKAIAAALATTSKDKGKTDVPESSGETAPPVPTEIDDTESPKQDVAGDIQAAKQKVRESFTGFASKFKHVEEEVKQSSDLIAILSNLFDFDAKAKKPHEMVEALEIQGVHTWRGFLLMAEEDIQILTKNSKDGLVPISKNAIRMLTYLKQFTLHNITTGVENAKNPETYTSDAFDAFVEDLQLGRKSAVGKEEEASPNQKRDIRASLVGFASKLKPDVQVEYGSITDILSKTKAKVFRKSGGAPNDDTSVGAASTGSESTDLATVPGDVVFEVMQKQVDDLASELETTTTNIANKKEVQQRMVPLLAKLKSSQDKFAAMIEARKMKKEQKEADDAEAAAAECAEASSDGAAESSSDDKTKLKNLLSSAELATKKALTNAEAATKKAFENAEKVARQAARKAGILDDEAQKEVPEEPTAAATNKDPALASMSGDETAL